MTSEMVLSSLVLVSCAGLCVCETTGDCDCAVLFCLGLLFRFASRCAISCFNFSNYNKFSHEIYRKNVITSES